MKIRLILQARSPRSIRQIDTDQPLHTAAQIMTAENVGVLAVTDAEKNFVGTICYYDLLRAADAYEGDLRNALVHQVMTKCLVCCDADDDVENVLAFMREQRIHYVPVVEGEDLISFLNIEDVTLTSELLATLAKIDTLTGLPNRHALVEILVKELSRCARYDRVLSFAMIGIDRLKEITARYDRESGIKVVEAVAQVIVDDFRNVDWVGHILLPAGSRLGHGGHDQGRHADRGVHRAGERVGSTQWAVRKGLVERPRTAFRGAELRAGSRQGEGGSYGPVPNGRVYRTGTRCLAARQPRSGFVPCRSGRGGAPG